MQVLYLVGFLSLFYLAQGQYETEICSGGCTETVAYWQANTAEWSDSHDNLICTRTWLEIMQSTDSADEFGQLWISSQLNLQLRDACTTDLINQAITELGAVLNSCARKRLTAIEILNILTAYNNGEIGPGQCEGGCVNEKGYFKQNTPWVDNFDQFVLCSGTSNEFTCHDLVSAPVKGRGFVLLGRAYCVAQANVNAGAAFDADVLNDIDTAKVILDECNDLSPAAVAQLSSDLNDYSNGDLEVADSC